MASGDRLVQIAKANQASVIVRRQRAEIKRRIKSRDLSLAAALRLPISTIGDMAVYELLLSCPQFGHPRLAILNSYAILEGVNLFLPVVTLTERQRLWIVAGCATVARGVEGDWVREGIRAELSCA